MLECVSAAWCGHYYAMKAEKLLPMLSKEVRNAAAAVEAAASGAGQGAEEEEPPTKAPKIKLAQILWVDEKHSKCVLGCSSKHEYLIPSKDGTQDGEYLHPDEGGEMPERMPTIVPKFGQEARMAFGVGMKEVRGEMTGFKMLPFNYTGTKLVGPKKFEKRRLQEIAAVLQLKGGGWEKYEAKDAIRLPGGRYEMRYGANWEEKLKEACAKNHDGREAMTSVLDLVDHVVKEGNRLFEGTEFENTWVIYHDALLQWWEKGTQAHLLSLGFPPARQMCCQGETNKGTRYEGKLVGDTPEFMPLDTNLFSDYEVSMSQHVATTCRPPASSQLTTSDDSLSAILKSSSGRWSACGS